MNPNQFKGIYLDDDASQAKTYSQLMSFEYTPEETLEVTNFDIESVGKLSTKIFESNPDIVIIDFRLDETPEKIDPDESYKGSTLAQQLRDKIIDSMEDSPNNDFPLVLISAEDKRNQFRLDSTAHDLFDSTHTKEEFEEPDSLEVVQNILFSLCRGYRDLMREWNGDRLNVLSDDDDERETVDIQEIRSLLEDASAPHNAARGILRDIIHRTGILLRREDVAALLGIKIFDDELEGFFFDHDFEYSGIFSEGWKRWWAHKIEDWAEDLFGTRPSSLTGAERAKIINEKLGINTEAAVSQWTNSPDEKFSFACASCGNPTEVKHSCSAFDPNVPVHGKQKRICWCCIATDKHKEKGLLIQDSDKSIADEVKGV